MSIGEGGNVPMISPKYQSNTASYIHGQSHTWDISITLSNLNFVFEGRLIEELGQDVTVKSHLNMRISFSCYGIISRNISSCSAKTSNTFGPISPELDQNTFTLVSEQRVLHVFACKLQRLPI